MHPLPSYKLFPSGDTGLVIDFGNVIDESINKWVHAVFSRLQNNPFPGMIEAVPGYSSVTIYYDVTVIRKNLNGHATAFEWMCGKIKDYLLPDREIEYPETFMSIPACYDKEYGPDLEFIASQNKISTEEIIHLHTSTIYRVYMLGFLPGFPYMGILNERIACGRKQQPMPVEPGSIGIAGKQTGIYPLRSPGGWQIIGRTPLKLFDKDSDSPVLFRSGTSVQFYSITNDEFENIKSRNA